MSEDKKTTKLTIDQLDQVAGGNYPENVMYGVYRAIRPINAASGPGEVGGVCDGKTLTLVQQFAEGDLIRFCMEAEVFNGYWATDSNVCELSGKFRYFFVKQADLELQSTYIR